jgi:polyhydroxybutyrate depolymerase
MMGGLGRQYFLHFPPGYDGRVPAPLVMNFHGNTSTPAEQQALSRVTGPADDAGVVTLHALGYGGSWNGGVCCGQAVGSGIDDVGFVSAVLDEVIGSACIDPERVYAMGFSNGGLLAHRLGCELSSRMAAVGSVAGVTGVSCAPSRPVPVIAFHGTADPLVPYLGDVFFAGAEVNAEGWAARDGCGTAWEVSYQRGDATCRRALGCPAGVDVELCTIAEGGHTWPGGLPLPSLGKTSTDVSASPMMLEFFLAHPRR